MPALKQYRRILRVFLGLTTLALAARCAIHLVSHNYNLSAEANGLYGVLEVGDGKPLYASRDERPYAVHLYPPVYAMLAGSLVRWLGPGSLHGRVMFVRALSFLCLMAICGILYGIFLKGKKLSTSVLVFIAVITLSKFADYATASRNDMLSVLWDVAAVAALLQWWRYRGKGWLAGLLVFSVLSFYTRQTGTAVFGGMMIWLWAKGERRLAVGLSFVYVGLVALVFWGINHSTHGAFYEQVFLANLRGFRRLDRQFFDPSMISFLVSYLLFAVLVVRGIRLSRAEKPPELQLLAACAGLSLVLSGAVFLRAGGDVNYFFEAIVFGSVFAVIAAQRFIDDFHGSWGEWSWLMGALIQLVLISVLFSLKTYSAYEAAFLPYEALASRVIRELPPFGYLVGGGAQNMGIHLRGWAIYGPDVTNSGYVAKNAHPTFRSLIKDLLRDVVLHRIHSMVVVDPLCQASFRRIKGTYRKEFPVVEDWAPWFCVYRDRATVGGSEITMLRPQE